MKLIDADLLGDELRKIYATINEKQISDREKLAQKTLLLDVLYTINNQTNIVEEWRNQAR